MAKISDIIVKLSASRDDGSAVTLSKFEAVEGHYGQVGYELQDGTFASGVTWVSERVVESPGFDVEAAVVDQLRKRIDRARSHRETVN